MTVPILKMGPYLIASVQWAVGDADLLELRDELMRSVRRVRALGVVVDVTALDVLDSFATRMLRELSAMVRLLGAETVVVGLQPEVAFAMVQLGLEMEGVSTALDLEEGVEALAANLARNTNDGR